MWVKICGLTRLEDVRACCDAGADAVGLNLYTGPRLLDLKQAGTILDGLSSGVTPVALVKCQPDHIDERILSFLGDYGVRHLQLYGELSPALLAELAGRDLRVIVACRVAGDEFAAGLTDLLQTAGGAAAAWAVLLDTFQGGQAGGTGRAFPWKWVDIARRRGSLAGWPKVILAGGLTARNVAQAIQTAQPFGVDVCSGVESEPGIKDHAAIRAFVEAARQAAALEGPINDGFQRGPDTREG
jgi:phosphoribosylanthranilate isomerase